MADSVDLIAKNTGADGKVAAKDMYDTSALPQPPIKPCRSTLRCRGCDAVRTGPPAPSAFSTRRQDAFPAPSRGAPDIVALERVSYSFKQGELVSLLGPSGCGKTTLLRIVAGMTAASSGRVEVRGREVTGPQEDFGFVFQAPNLLPWRTVLANVLFPDGNRRAQRRRGEEARAGAAGVGRALRLRQKPAASAFRRHEAARRAVPGAGAAAVACC